MAYFKISLLTYQFQNNKTILLQDVISEFNTQQNVYNSKQKSEENFEYLKDRKYSFCYSYDEKFSLSQNAQKTLSFNLDKFIIKQDVREENPFARNIIIGSQILLVDQYDNQYFFTVKDIDYDIKETNITYKISCQDTFSYQLTRQNSGYTIDNDSSTSDFIGAKTVDWWVENRISPDCHLNYKYLTLNQGLCELKDGSFKIFDYGEKLTNVKRILKEAYSIEQEKDRELFQTIPFSCSGSNANAALISLGENLDLQLKTFENIGRQLERDLMPGYTKVQYLKSTGTQYIDINFKPNQDTSIYCDGEMITSHSLFGVAIPNSFFNVTSNDVEDGVDYAYWYNEQLGVDTKTGRAIYELKKNKYSKNGEPKGTTEDFTNWQSPVSCYLFGRNAGYLDDAGTVKIYSCKVWDNEKLIRDFIPVTRDSDKKPGLYDLINNKFYENKGTEEFLFKEEYTKIDYIESTGTQYFNFSDPDILHSVFEYDIQFMNCDTRQLMGYNGLGGNYWGINESGYYETYTSWLGMYLAGGRDIIKDDCTSSSVIDRYINGTLAYNGLVDETPTTYTALSLDGGFYCYVRLYGLKIYNASNELIRNYIPVIKNSTKEACLYDTINNVFKSNDGTGVFKVPYIEQKSFDLLRYFWLEPKKNSNRIGGLIYSPYNSIQSFGLSHKGDSLTTILNVEGPTYEDEIITLIPALTPHFSNFIKETSWNTNYRKGMFLSQCEPQKFLLNDEKSLESVRGYSNLYYSGIGAGELTIPSSADFSRNVTYDRNKGVLYIKLFNDASRNSNLKLNKLFTFLNFNNNLINSNLSIDDGSEQNLLYKPSNKYRWTLNFVETIEEDNNTQYLITSFKEGEDISEFVNKDVAVWMGIFIGSYEIEQTITISNFKPNLSFSREVSQEDIDFANAAEECPWLENKLIDFNYFLESKMITPEEYIDLTNILLNDLRIVNGNLMFYSKAYYQALHDKTKELAALTNQLDLLGATVEADILSTIRTEGSIDEDSNISSFDNAYTDTLLSSVEKQKILNYNEILTDYFNKFFNAEQRFLRNIKKFEDYFNSLPSTWLNKENAFYDYILELTSNDYIIETTIDSTELRSISDTEYKYIESGEKCGLPLYDIYTADKKIYNPVTALNYKNYYIKNPITEDETGMVKVQSGELFEKEWKYYSKTSDVYAEITTKSIKEKILEDNTNNVCYRDYSPKEVFFNTLDSTALADLLTLDSELRDRYKEEFPVKTIYLKKSDNEEYEYDFVNESTYSNFYQIKTVNKLSNRQKWEKGLFNAERDIYGTKQENSDSINRSYLYCSSINPDKKYKSEDEPQETVGITYNYAAAAADNRFYFKESTFFTAVKHNDIANKKSTYKIYQIPDGMTESSITAVFEKELGATAYWPLYQELAELNFDGIEIKDGQSWQSIFGNSAIVGQSDYEWEIDNILFIVVEVKNYSLKQLTSTFEYDSSKTYCTMDDREIDFYNQPFPYSDTEQTSYYHHEKPYIHPTEEFNLNEKYYQIKSDNEDEFEQVLTVLQLINSNQIYQYKDPKKLKLNYISPRETKIPVILSKLIITKDSNGNIIDFSKEKALTYDIYFTKDEVHAEPLDYYKNDHVPATIEDLIDNHIDIYQEKDFNIENDILKFKLIKHWAHSINVGTNGNLWYQCTFGDLSAQASAVSIAATIEAELESYWQQAYNASLYCRYFLPESWQPRYNKETNYFCNDILNITANSVSLNNKYIPIVSIYKEKGNTILPKYYISKKINEIDNSTIIDSTTIASNPIIVETINYLGENIKDFNAVESGTTSYYYIEKKNEKTGCTWSKFMSEKVSPQYSEYSGIYDLSYRLFKKNYEDFGITEYEFYKDEQQKIWQTLYNRFGYLMLENNYKDENATTSAELMVLAKNAFKDYSAPERQYNITVIDSTSLKNYKGGEIRIGDGIQIDAQAYYNEYDQIFKSLSQYLFVTDISYTLRSPTDISLTVNTIKYQDKLIQRLARLIK